MDKKVINEDQFRKLVIKEANKIFSDEEKSAPITEGKVEQKSKFSFEDVENLINEMEVMNTSITSINLVAKKDTEGVIEESNSEKESPKRDLDVIEHNRKKNVKHVNESEKDRIKRMLSYNVPKDEER